MKKIYFLLVLVVVIFTSCSSDSGSNSNVLLKELHSVTVGQDGFTSDFTFKYFFNGNKLSSIEADGNWINEYTYNGDLIESMSNYVNGDLALTVLYEYDAQSRLMSQTATGFQQEGAFTDIVTYTYNNDNTITRLSYNESVDPSNLYQTSKIILNSSGQFIKLQELIEGIWVNKIEATYTSYYSGFKNVTGYNELMSLSDTNYSFATYQQMNNTINPQFNSTAVFEYTVNQANYPTQRIQTTTKTDGSTSVTTSDYIYY